MKKQKLQAKLEANENAQKEKLFGTVVEKEEEPKVEEVQAEQPEEEQKEKKTSKSKKKEENA